MNLRIGTPGYSHPEWKGIFYPEKISQEKMLEYYCDSEAAPITVTASAMTIATTKQRQPQPSSPWLI